MLANKKINRRISLIISSLFAQFAVPISNIVVSILVVRWFSKGLWGAYVAHLLVVSLFLTVINWGSKDYLLKTFSKHPHAIAEHLMGSISGKCLLAIVVTILLYFIPLGGLHKNLIIIFVWIKMGSQFFESLNIFRRLFLPVAILESSVVLAIILGLNFIDITLERLLLFFIIADGCKLVGYSWLNRQYFRSVLPISTVKGFFRASFPFFLLTGFSLAASRADLYLLGLWEEAGTLAQYQILVNFIQYAHLFATAIMIPFLGNIFRLRFQSILQLEQQFLYLGLLLAVFLTSGIYLVTYYLYQFDLSITVILLIYLNIVVFYFYFLRIPAGFSFNKMWSVIIVMACMGGMNLILGILIIPTLGMIGGLLSSLSSGLVGVLGFRSKKLFNLQ